MTRRRQHVAALGLLTAVTLVGAACGDGGGGSGSDTSTTSSAVSVSSAPSTATQAASVTPAQFCGFLSNTDLSPLIKPPLTSGPEPSQQNGLAGCDWSLGDADAHLVLSLFKAPQPEALINSASSEFKVGPSATGYVTVPGLLGSCMALVRTSSAPQGMFLRYSLRSYDDRLQGCEPGLPQVRKVLGELGW